MLFTRSKQCPLCLERKPLTGFHKDRTRADGRAGTCIVCRNKNRKPKKAKKVKPISGYAQPVAEQLPVRMVSSIKVAENLVEQAFADLKSRLQTHFSLSVDRKGIFHLQTHGNPSEHFRSDSIAELLAKVREAHPLPPQDQ